MLAYVRTHPLEWSVPSHILYGEHDSLTEVRTMSRFACRIKADLSVMSNGEHWFHTAEQMAFVDSWIGRLRGSKGALTGWLLLFVHFFGRIGWSRP